MPDHKSIPMPIEDFTVPERKPPASVLEDPALASRLHFDLHGLFRARYENLHNVPVARLDTDGTLASAPHTGRDDASNWHFVYSRLRLEPTLRYGGEQGEGAKAHGDPCEGA